MRRAVILVSILIPVLIVAFIFLFETFGPMILSEALNRQGRSLSDLETRTTAGRTMIPLIRATLSAVEAQENPANAR